MLRIEMEKVSFWENIESQSKWINFFEAIVSWSGKDYKIERLKDEGLYGKTFRERETKWKSMVKNILRIFLLTITLSIPCIVKAINRKVLKSKDQKTLQSIAKKNEFEDRISKKKRKREKLKEKIRSALKELFPSLSDSENTEKKISPHTEESKSSSEEESQDPLPFYPNLVEGAV